MISFEAEDEAVIDRLTRAKNMGRGEQSRLINEAIRIHGDRALLNVLERDVEIAQSKFEAAQNSILKNSRSGD